jgi:hypothetical protein
MIKSVQCEHLRNVIKGKDDLSSSLECLPELSEFWKVIWGVTRSHYVRDAL